MFVTYIYDKKGRRENVEICQLKKGEIAYISSRLCAEKKCDLFNKSHEYDDGSTETFFNIFNSAELFYKMINEILYDGYEQHYSFDYFIEQFNARIYPLCFQIEYNV